MASNKVPITLNYLDVLFVGKTGQGKSTTANKLLIAHGGRIMQFGSSNDRLLRYETARGKKLSFPVDEEDSDESCTTVCQLLCNDFTKVRVLDTPGFAGSHQAHEEGTFRSNLEFIRNIVEIQFKYDLKFKRVVYFLPVKHALTKADGDTKSELRVLEHYFGSAIFDIMVIAATISEEFQSIPYSDEMKEKSASCITKILNQLFKKEMKCPPIVYVPIEQRSEDVYASIIGAQVLDENLLSIKKPERRLSIMMRTSSPESSGQQLVHLEYPVITSPQSSGQQLPNTEAPKCATDKRLNIWSEGRKLEPQACLRCSLKVEYNDKTLTPQFVINKHGEKFNYSDSKCHPAFLPQYGKFEKFIGGIFHIFTAAVPLLIGKVVGSESWAGFTNSDKICPACWRGPGSIPCKPVDQVVTVKIQGCSVDIIVAHKNALDHIKKKEDITCTYIM